MALFFTQWFYALPEAALGAIVIVAVSGMIKVAKFKHLYRVRRADFILAVVALLAVLTFETLEALLIAVVVSLFALVWRTSPAQAGGAGSCARQPPVRRHPPASGKQDLPGLLIVRPENGLFFANAEGIREVILSEMQSNAEPVKAVLLDLGATTDLDVPSADMLGEAARRLAGRKVRLMLVRMIMPVRQMLELAGVMAKIRPEDVFVGPAEAVLDYLSSQYDAAGIHELLRSSALSVRQLVQAHLPAVPVERQVALTTLVDNLDQAIQRNEM